MTAREVMDARSILRARVALHLQNGCSHQEALRRAQAPVLVARTHPQSPAHAVKA